MAQWTRAATYTALGLVALGGAMVATNPAAIDYETFVAQQLQDRLQQECSRAGSQLLGNLAHATCYTMTRVGSPYFSQTIKPLIASRTQRYDWLLLSWYVTDLSVPQFNFSGRIESLGLFDRFIVYRLP
jgi:hypothetical protein